MRAVGLSGAYYSPAPQAQMKTGLPSKNWKKFFRFFIVVLQFSIFKLKFTNVHTKEKNIRLGRVF